ncbi:uncharacterized protein LOC117901045 [Drosophila subobscura]|uniref:uncharacterized protein LOC117901045 n=1 Tax=Drosophila subobscura TaxID=7241 RepID=UPI00155A7831|nr:uncharacterized protein LOC117901045 [Drosophila subobscura]
MSHALVNEETLETLVYKRSRTWAHILKFYTEIDDGEELDVVNFEDLFKAEDIDPDVQEDEEAAEDARQEEDLGMGNINTATAMSKAELTMILCAGENKAETAELEMLYQTMSVVQEHDRK